MKIPQIDIERIRRKWELVSIQLDERSRRIWAGVEALSYGYGGIRLVHLATGMSENTVRRGKDESQKMNLEVSLDRVRAKGGGRKRKLETSPDLLEHLERLIQPHTKGDPMNPLRWTPQRVPTVLRLN